MNFGELVSRVRTWRGSESGTEAASTLAYIKDTVNAVYREVLSSDDQQWSVEEYQAQTQAPYQSGTVMATNGMTRVSLVAGNFLPAHAGGRLEIGGNGNYYNVVKVDGSSAYLDRPYQGTTTDTGTYSIYADLVPLPGDFRKMESVAYMSGSRSYRVPSRTPDGLDHWYPNVLDPTPTDEPEEYSIWKRRKSAWFTATATLTSGSRQVDFAFGTSSYGVQNWRFQVLQTAAGERYTVDANVTAAAADALSVELTTTFTGTTATGTSVQVGPVGTPYLQVYPPPTESYTMIMKYLSGGADLVNDSDEPIIPEEHHDVIWKGAVYYIAQFDEDIGPERTALYLRDFESARLRLNKYKAMSRDTRLVRRQYGSYVDLGRSRFPDTVAGRDA